MDQDPLVRTCLVRFSLVQNMPKKERDSYKGVTVKSIRVAIQRLVMILPQEEQTNIRPITEEETIAVFKDTAKEKGNHDHRVLKTMTRNAKSSFIPNLMRYRSEFEEILEEESLVDQCKFDYNYADHRGKEKFSRVDQCRLDNISMDHKGEAVFVKLCEYCNQ